MGNSKWEEPKNSTFYSTPFTIYHLPFTYSKKELF